MAYATVEDLLHEMGMPAEDADEDTLQEKLDAAQDIIDRVTARAFEATADETRLIDCTPDMVNGRTLHIPYDLCQITTILNGDGVAVTADEYVTEPRLRTVSGGVSSLPAVRNAYPWYAITLKTSSGKAWTYDTDPEEAISITGRFAYSTTAPAAIKNACIRLADWLYQQRNDLRDRQESGVSEDGILLLMSDLPNDIQARLIPFVRV
ncbi:MAG: hypothetical protein HC804_04560 [Anaerolineae bacterium]|nr:hypothetical protein [Anaerolineae bacterium]